MGRCCGHCRDGQTLPPARSNVADRLGSRRRGAAARTGCHVWIAGRQSRYRNRRARRRDSGRHHIVHRWSLLSSSGRTGRTPSSSTRMSVLARLSIMGVALGLGKRVMAPAGRQPAPWVRSGLGADLARDGDPVGHMVGRWVSHDAGERVRYRECEVTRWRTLTMK